MFVTFVTRPDLFKLSYFVFVGGNVAGLRVCPKGADTCCGILVDGPAYTDRGINWQLL